MVRGNWQKRVELADARRKEAKQRKQRSEDKRQYKAWVHDFLHMLDQYSGGSGRKKPLQLHVWTDTIPSDSPPLLDILEGDSGGVSSKRRNRSGSIESNSSGRTKGRSRSNSIQDEKNTGKKKAHPRSKEVGDNGGDEEDGPLLCRPHFFTGKCNESSAGGKKKGGGCRYVHYSNMHKTIASVFAGSLKKSERLQAAIRDAEVAVVKTTATDMDPEGTQDNGMEMIYYLPVNITGNEETGSISSEVYEALAASSITAASIAYVATGEALLFDRYREGACVTSEELASLLHEEAGESSPRKISVGCEGDAESVGILASILPGIILEHILSFMPDKAVAIAAKVCKAWNTEISCNSPNLWLTLLKRRSWPVPEYNQESHEEGRSVCQCYRDAFIKHYLVVRDTMALKLGLTALCTRRLVQETEMCFQDFANRKHSPSEPNSCVSIQIWSAQRMLVGYSHDCSLRLFETSPRTEGKEMLCRELVCRRIDPYKNTKRRSCVLVSMGLDGDSIGCLCHVISENVEREAYVLIVLSRDDFLLGESSDVVEVKSGTVDTDLKVIDVGEAVLNFLLCSDDLDSRMLVLTDFLSDGGEVGDIEIIASQSIATCGFGRFVVEVSISIPALEDFEDPTELILLDRKLVMFSADAGAIVWMGPSQDPSNALRPRHEDMSLSFLHRRLPGTSRSECDIVVGTSFAPFLLATRIEQNGQIYTTNGVEASELGFNEIIEEGWELAGSPHRVVIMSSLFVIVADVIHRMEDDRVVEHKSTLLFYPLNRDEGVPLYSLLRLSGDIEVVRGTTVRDEHVLLLCRHYQRTVEAEADSESVIEISICAILVHIPTKSEIGRLTLLDRVGPDIVEVPVISLDIDDTIGLALSWKGVVMTGNGVRSHASQMTIVLEDSPLKSHAGSGKKKKKRKGAKGGKKDGFARGMSLRG